MIQKTYLVETAVESGKAAKSKPPAHGCGGDVLDSGGTGHANAGDYRDSAGMVSGRDRHSQARYQFFQKQARPVVVAIRSGRCGPAYRVGRLNAEGGDVWNPRG